VAQQINDNGDVVGGVWHLWSFNTNFLYNLVPVHALLWENGKATDLGNLGGTTGQAGGNIAYDINNKAVVRATRTSQATQLLTLLWTSKLGCRIWAHSPAT